MRSRLYWKEGRGGGGGMRGAVVKCSQEDLRRKS